MKFIFLTLPAYGHLNPTLGVAKELVRRRHKVIVYNTEDFRVKIEKTGAEFRPPPIKVKIPDLRVMQNAEIIAKLNLQVTKQILPNLERMIEIEKPDCVLHDAMNLWGKLAGIRSKTPSVSLVTSMVLHPAVLLKYTKFLLPDYFRLIKHTKDTFQIFKDYRNLYKKVGRRVPFITDMFINSEKLNLVFTSKYFQPCSDRLSRQFKFVGPIIYERPETPLPINTSDKPIIYIALGTVYNDNTLLYRTFVKIFANTPFRIYLSFGSYIKPQALGEIPENITIGNYLPQLSILKKASLFISHGGMNSVNESLYYGVPMLFFPFIQEQRANAARVQELGAGISWDKKPVEKDSFMTAVNELLTNKTYKENAHKIEKTLKDAGGYKKAADLIVDYAYL
ncbi:hypothetical protein M1271_03045 [Patescibacteria group bacterium]|nr:hypothetical protein [Patescibacteria group bacterium]MCL5798116.1 hypothetical protein [Patescibacteria group bacterium]